MTSALGVATLAFDEKLSQGLTQVSADEVARHFSKSLAEMTEKERWGEILSGVERVDVKWMLPRPYESGDLAETTLPSFDLRTVPEGPESTLAYNRVKSEIMVGGFMRVTKILLCLKAALGSEWFRCPFVSIVGSYVQELGGIPFFESTAGTVYTMQGLKEVETIPIHDSHAPKKVSICARSILDWWSGIYGPDLSDIGGPDMPSLGVNIAKFILRDPYRQWAEVKKIRGLGSFQMFARTKKGSFMPWRIAKEEEADKASYVMGSTPLKVSDIDTDEWYARFMSEQWLELKDELSPEMVQLWDAYNWLITADLTDDALRAATWLRGPEAVVGFVSGDPTMAANDQIQGIKMDRVMQPEHEKYDVFEGVMANVQCGDARCFDCQLQAKWAQAIRIGSAGRKPSTHRWKSGMLAAMTSKSSGVAPVTIKGVFRGEPIEVKSNKKITTFLLDPDLVLSGAALIEACQTPARLTFRWDIARDPRMVVLNRVPKFGAEQAWGMAITNWALKSADAPKLSFAFSSDRFLADTGPAVVSTTTADSTKMVICWDMTAMDGHSRPENVLYNRLAGILIGLRDVRVEDDFGDFGKTEDGQSGIMTMAKMVYESYINGEFIMTNAVTGVDTAFSNRALLSGEFLTTLTHGITNIVLAGHFIDWFNSKYPDAMGAFGTSSIMEWINFTGDDAISVVVAAWDYDKYVAFIELITDLGAKLGFPFNPIKTLMRRRAFEYLKKFVVYGVHVPLAARIAPFETERGGFNNTLPEKISGTSDKLLEYVVRGGDNQKVARLRMWLTAALLNVTFQGQDVEGATERKATRKLTKSEESRKIFNVDVPFTWAIMPTYFGGQGLWPTSMIAGKSDAVMMAVASEEVRSRIAEVAGQTKEVRFSAGDIIDPLRTFPDFRKGVQFQKTLQSAETISRAAEAQDEFRRLTGKRIDPQFMYQNAPELTVESLLKGILEIPDVLSAGKATTTAFLKPAVAVNLSDTTLAWVDLVDVSFGDPVNEVYPEHVVTPVAGGHGDARYAFRQIGVAATASTTRPLAQMIKLMATTSMKHLTPEGVLEKIYKAKWHNDPAAINAFFVSMGADPLLAADVAGTIANSEVDVLAISEMEAWTMKDSFRALLNVGPTTWDRFVTVKFPRGLPLHGKQEHSMLLQYGMLRVMAESAPYRHVTITASPEFETFYAKKVLIRPSFEGVL